MDLRYQQCYHNYFPNTAQFNICMGEVVPKPSNNLIINTKEEVSNNTEISKVQQEEHNENKEQDKNKEHNENKIEELSNSIKTKKETQRMGIFQTFKFLYFHFFVPNIDNLLKFTLLILILLLGQYFYL